MTLKTPVRHNEKQEPTTHEHQTWRKKSIFDLTCEFRLVAQRELQKPIVRSLYGEFQYAFIAHSRRMANLMQLLSSTYKNLPHSLAVLKLL